MYGLYIFAAIAVTYVLWSMYVNAHDIRYTITTPSWFSPTIRTIILVILTIALIASWYTWAALGTYEGWEFTNPAILTIAIITVILMIINTLWIVLFI